MRNILIMILIATLFISCESLDNFNSSSTNGSRILSPNINTSVSSTLETSSSSRTIILNGEYYTEEETGKFVSWECRDFSDMELPYGLEVGYFSNPEFDGKGFLLFDGGNSGIKTFYKREGVNRRWDWDNYTILIKPDGTGLYYDFTNIPEGEATSARDIFKCVMK